MTRLEVALSYLDKGFSIIPLWSPEMLNTKPPKSYIETLEKELAENKESENPVPEDEIRQKHLITKCKTPIIQRWTVYQKRFPTKQEVLYWFTTYPAANIAIITGKLSGCHNGHLRTPDGSRKQGGFKTS